MKLGACVSEGRRNAVAGGLRSITFTLLFVAITVATAFVDGRSLQVLHDAEREAWRDGRNLVVVRADQGIDGKSCEQVAVQPTIVAAGAMRRTDHTVALVGRPGASPRLVEVTPGVHRVAASLGRSSISQPPSANEFAASRQTKEALEFRERDRYTIAHARAEPLALVGSYDLSFLTVSSSGVFAIRPADGSFDLCMVLAQPGRARQAEAVAAANVHAYFVGERVETVADIGGRDRDLVAEHRSRSTRHVWAVGALALAMVWLLMEAARRPERGLYLSVGLTPVKLTVVRVAELVVLTAAGASAAIALGSAALLVGGIDAFVALPSLSLSVVGVSSSLVLSGTIAAALTRKGTTIDMVKDRG